MLLLLEVVSVAGVGAKAPAPAEEVDDVVSVGGEVIDGVLQVLGVDSGSSNIVPSGSRRFAVGGVHNLLSFYYPFLARSVDAYKPQRQFNR